jgi:hypothetical protein
MRCSIWGKRSDIKIVLKNLILHTTFEESSIVLENVRGCDLAKEEHWYILLHIQILHMTEERESSGQIFEIIIIHVGIE